MINWKKDTWEEVKFTLDALELEYEVDFEGNLIICFSDFDIIHERSKEVVDHVDRLWLKFVFWSGGTNYDLKFFRNDVYYTKPDYTHPHVSSGNHCTGDYIRGVSLCKDLLYYVGYVKHYNKGDEYTTIPKNTKLSIDVDAMNKAMVPTFYMDITKGYPVAASIEFTGNVDQYFQSDKLTNPKTYFWKNNSYTQYSKGSKKEHIDFKQYFDYARFYKRYSDATSSVSDANPVQEVS